MAGDVAAAEAVVDTVLHLEVIHEDGNVMLMMCFYRVNKGGWKLLQFSHPASILDDPGPIRDDRRPARHLSWFIKIRTIVPTLLFNHQVVSHRSLVPSTVELCPRSQSEKSDLIISSDLIIFDHLLRSDHLSLIIILIDQRLTTIISEGSRTRHSFCRRALPPARFPKLKIKTVRKLELGKL